MARCRSVVERVAEEIRHALLMVKGVLSVTPSVTDIGDHMNRERVRHELLEKLLAVLKDPVR